MKASRRKFLQTASALSAVAGSAATPFALNLAAMGSAAAQTAPTDYKALVCVFLYGGNDHSNVIVPYDNANYQLYAQSRTNLALGQNQLLPLMTPSTNASMSGRQVSMRAEMSAVKALYDQGKVAVLANIGPLISDTTMAQYQSRTVSLPMGLFSHSDQQSTWQSYGPEGTPIGWGGRIGDLFAANNQYQTFTCMSPGGQAVFLSGASTIQVQIGNNGFVNINALAAGANVYGSTTAATNVKSMITGVRTNTLENEYNIIVKRASDAAATLNGALNSAAVSTQFPNTGLAQQLKLVAKTIAARSSLGSKRQIFHVSMGGFDQHQGIVQNHGALWAQISNAMAAFYQSTVELGISNNVTAFTASDFGRTLDSNGEGSDHGWGAHHLVVGGAVKGGDIYGEFPVTVLRGPNDVGRGNLLPSTSVDQLVSTLGTWFGVSNSQLTSIAPNINNYAKRDLGLFS